MNSVCFRSRIIFTGLVALSSAVSIVALGAESASAAEGAIDSVSCEGEVGGYSPYLQFGCNLLKVTVGDSTPSGASAYTVDFNGTNIAPFVANGGSGTVDLLGYDPVIEGLVSGTSYPVSVSEASGISTPSFPYAYSAVTAPVAATPVLSNGSYKTGVKSVVQFEGTWEEGSTVTTKVVANIGGTRPEAVQNSSSEIAVTSVYNTATNAIEFTLPASAAGRFIWVSASATKLGKASSGFRLTPVTAAGMPTYNPAWVRSFGSKTGTAKVGRTVGITAPVFTNSTIKAKTMVTYKWFGNSKVISGATRPTLKLTTMSKGKAIILKESFKADGYKPYVRSVKYGRVK